MAQHAHARHSFHRPHTLFAAALVLSMLLGLMSGVPTAEAATITVSPSTLASTNWSQQHTVCGSGAATGSQSFVTGPGTPPLGIGSLQLAAGANGGSFEQARLSTLNGVPLTDLRTLSYSTYVSQTGTGGQAPYINLLVDWDSNGSVDDQLFFEPVYQTGAYAGPPVPNQGTVTTNTWQTWNALVGGWWSLSAGTFGPPLVTLASYAAVHPGARIVNSGTSGGFAIAIGCGAGAWNNFVGNVDNLTIQVGSSEANTYNFEPDMSTTTATATGTTTPTATLTRTPTTTATTTSTTTATPATATLTSTSTATPTATASITATQTATTTATLGRKVGICHRTGSSTNPWVFIEVSQNAVPAHRDHGDIIGVSGANQCPQTTPVPTQCDHRGNVNVTTTPDGPGRLRVTLTANNTAGLPPNQISQLQFGPVNNGVVTVNGQTSSTDFNVSLPPGTQTITFSVARQTAGQATTVHLNAIDQCGEWRTMIGGGPNAF